MPERFTPVEFKPYGKRRGTLPRWLLLVVAGIAIGAGAVMLVQEHYLPERLSTAESIDLQRALAQSERERKQHAGDLEHARRELERALADKTKLSAEAGAARATTEKLRGDLAALLALMPPDPRPGAIAVRAGRLALNGSSLAYDIVLSRDAGGEPLAGMMQFVVAAETGRAAAKPVTLGPIAFSLGKFENLRGSVPVPDGIKPQRATIELFDPVDGKRLGTRILYVR